MTNAERILRQFDQGLDHEIRLALTRMMGGTIRKTSPVPSS